MGTESQFKTYQTVRYYEQALARHGQWCRWTRALTCACITATRQPDINCPLCKGRGHIYKNPGPFEIRQEVAKHDGNGVVTPKYTPVVGNITAWKSNASIPLGTQPVDGSHIKLGTPYPLSHQRVRVGYDYSPLLSVVGENSQVYGLNTLRVIAARFYDKGKEYEGSISDVTRVYNVTKDEIYAVTLAQKEYVYLENMGTWSVDDVLEVDYTYVQPFDFVLHSISARKRYERAYVIDSADATLITPYWAQLRPDDLITSLSAILPAVSIINPTLVAGNDEVADYYDLAYLTDVIDKNGVVYTIGTDVVLYGRNEIQWLTTKPIVNYTVHFMYHPTFVTLNTYDTSRHSENKSFVNRNNMMMYDKVSREVTF